MLFIIYCLEFLLNNKNIILNIILYIINKIYKIKYQLNFTIHIKVSSYILHDSLKTRSTNLIQKNPFLLQQVVGYHTKPVDFANNLHLLFLSFAKPLSLPLNMKYKNFEYLFILNI